MSTQVYLSSEDYQKLRLMLTALMRSQKNPGAAKLVSELDRAVILDSRALPPRIVRIGSRFEIQDLDSGEVDAYTLCFPERSNPELGQISVLAPIGTAVLGYGEGDVIDWETPGGVRRFRIRNVAQPALV